MVADNPETNNKLVVSTGRRLSDGQKHVPRSFTVLFKTCVRESPSEL